MFDFYTHWKRQKAKGFLTFSGGIKMDYWAKMGCINPFHISDLFLYPLKTAEN